MAEVSDIAVYQKLSAIADELDQMASEGATLVGGAALSTAARTVRGKRSQRQHGGDPTTRGGGVSPEATRVSERFPCQPASSSDRVR